MVFSSIRKSLASVVEVYEFFVVGMRGFHEALRVSAKSDGLSSLCLPQAEINGAAGGVADDARAY